MQDINPRCVSRETPSTDYLFTDICPYYDINDSTMDKNNDTPNEINKRKTFPNSIRNEAFRQYQDNKKFIHGINYNGLDRCPCCDRILTKDAPVRHIKSNKFGGIIDLNNCLIVCSRCNNCDVQSIPQMMIEEWGIDHDYTVRVERYLIRTNKQGKHIIPNKRRELLENQLLTNQFTSQT